MSLPTQTILILWWHFSNSLPTELYAEKKTNGAILYSRIIIIWVFTSACSLTLTAWRPKLSDHVSGPWGHSNSDQFHLQPLWTPDAPFKLSSGSLFPTQVTWLALPVSSPDLGSCLNPSIPKPAAWLQPCFYPVAWMDLRQTLYLVFKPVSCLLLLLTGHSGWTLDLAFIT